MFCRNCGNNVDTNAVACMKCGADPRMGKNFCPSCGVTTNANQIVCVKCGSSLAAAPVPVIVQDNSKTVAILAHITFLGWIIAIILNSQHKTELGSFYIRQMLGIFLSIFILIFIPIIGWIAIILMAILWLISLINAINDKLTPVPVIGSLFQSLFKGM